MKTKITPKIVLITFLVSTIISACTVYQEPVPETTIPAQDTPVPVTPTQQVPTSEAPDKNEPLTPIQPGGKAPINLTPISPADLPANLRELVNQSTSELAEALDIDENQIVLASAKSVVWSDSSLGCPQPDMNYLQVLTDGYQIILSADDNLYYYHANKKGYGIFCENPSPPYSEGAVDR
ncbi:MAG: hypothetical protein RBT01_11680 [Anaerolineaceae bacterium]|jgi:hypothetical protein|nr:hypothetical protein [Anaerolineaceae bacterium]